jgi:predicted phage baseplate assembly protein
MSEVINDCGCCAGAEPLPGLRFNAPGLDVIDYRIGRHGEFKAAMLARLSSADFPALAGLRTRADDDFSIALCDAGAVMFDVLSFYQERIAHEAYLRTSTERRSVLELSRLIGYQPSPGVAASTYLAFALEDAPGMPSLAATPVTIPVGTRAQSVPGPDEQPQTFETIAPITARVEWNAIPERAYAPQVLKAGGRELIIAGNATQVQVGDVILLVGNERLLAPGSAVWDACVVRDVEIDHDRGFTRLTFFDGFGAVSDGPPQQDVRAYVFRVRTAMYGHNAADVRLMRLTEDIHEVTSSVNNVNDTRVWWGYTLQPGRVDLDGSFAKVTTGSWVLLAGGNEGPGTGSLPGSRALVRAKDVRHMTRRAFGMSGKITRVVPDHGLSTPGFPLETTVVLAQSEELKLAERPLFHPVYGVILVLGRRDALLQRGQALACSGKRQRVRIVADAQFLLHLDSGSSVGVKQGDSLLVMGAPLDLPTLAPLDPDALDVRLTQPMASKSMRWTLMDRAGRRGTLDCADAALVLQAPLREDPVLSEIVFISTAANAILPAFQYTALALASALVNVYHRASFAACANLAPATVGESVSESAGSGDASAASQRFLLKQAPLTYVSAATPLGRSATLDVRIDGQRWTEVPSLFGRAPGEHVYALRHDDEQRTIVQFGDGIEGARLPTGRDNLRFGYRKNLGAGGNVRANQVSTLLSRPAGVRTVTNPVAANGGADRETRDDARRNAPLTVLTLGRAVSLRDYADFARAFAGIAKADAVWTRSGRLRGIFVSVAGPDGAAVPVSSQSHLNLVAALRRYGDSLLPLTVATYLPRTFRLKARIKVDARYLPAETLAKAGAALRDAFSFARRDFGQHVSLDEVMAVLQSVTGVEGVDVDQLHRVDAGAVPPLVPRLFALPPRELPDGTFQAAELLTLDPGPLSLKVMT